MEVTNKVFNCGSEILYSFKRKCVGKAKQITLNLYLSIEEYEDRQLRLQRIREARNYLKERQREV